MKEQKKSSGARIRRLVIPLGIGSGLGIILGRFLTGYMDELGFGQSMLFLGLGLLWFYAAILIETVLHEAGHLVGGLMSGYRFVSFRIGSFMLQREDGKLHLRKLSLAGTAGQCLMVPPELKNGRIPFALYHSGGVLMNLLTAAISGAMALIINNTAVTVMLVELAVSGLILGIMNGIPLRIGEVNNDGHNILEMRRSPDAVRAVWIQMKVAELQSAGKLLGDMPDDWFDMPDDAKLRNSLVFTLAVFRENRLMERCDTEGAYALCDKLLSRDFNIIGLYKLLLRCDRAVCGLLLGDKSAAEDFWTDEQKRFMKQMRSFPAVIRTEYALALLYDKNTARASELQAEFDKRAESYPYAGDIVSERGIMKKCADLAANMDKG